MLPEYDSGKTAFGIGNIELKNNGGEGSIASYLCKFLNTSVCSFAISTSSSYKTFCCFNILIIF